MSKTKLLLDVADGMRTLAGSIQSLAEAMTFSDPVETVPNSVSAPKPVIKVVTLEQVRAVLAEKSQAGFIVKVRGLLEKYGAPKLSQIDPIHYAALLSEAEDLK